MNWALFAQILSTFFVAALGWFVAHYFTSLRDISNERRKPRVSYLLEAYRRLESASNRGDTRECWQAIECALGDIQLLGSPNQVSLAKDFVIEVKKSSTGSLDKLMFDLRQSLRSELQLEAVDAAIVYRLSSIRGKIMSIWKKTGDKWP